MKNIKEIYKYLFFLISIIIVGLYCYFGLFDNYFYCDDGPAIVDAKKMMNVHFSNFFDVSKAKVHPYRFVVRLVWIWLLQIGNWNPLPFYLTIVILRIITGCLLFILVYRYLKNSVIAFCASLIFLVNFSTYEAAYWLSSVLYPVSLFFYVLVLITFLSDIENKNILKLVWLFLFYLIEIFSHENSLTLPIVCFAAFLVYNYERGISFPVQFSRSLYRFSRRYFFILFITILYLVIRFRDYGSVISLSNCLNSIISVAKSTLLWFIPEGILYRLIFFLNKLFHTNKTFNIQYNIFLSAISFFVFIVIVSFSIGLFCYFFVKKEKSCAVVIIMGLLIMILNIIPAVFGWNYGAVYGAIFPPSRELYYSSFGFSLVIAAIAKFLYDLQIKKVFLFRYIFCIFVALYVIVAVVLNKKMESAYHHDSNIFRIAHRDVKEKMSVFPPSSVIYIDLSSAKYKLPHTYLSQITLTVTELLNNELPFYKLPFEFNFLEQSVKNLLIQNLVKQKHPDPTFYFELVNGKLIMYRWDQSKKDFVLKD